METIKKAAEMRYPLNCPNSHYYETMEKREGFIEGAKSDAAKEYWLKDVDTILYSLNQTWNDAHNQLQGNELGDIERVQLEKIKAKTRELIIKFTG